MRGLVARHGLNSTRFGRKNKKSKSRESLPKKTAFRFLPGEGKGRFVGGPGFFQPAHSPAQVGPGGMGKVVRAQDSPLQQGVDVGHLGAEPVAPLEVPRGLPLLDQRGAVGAVLDHLSSAPGARVRGDLSRFSGALSVTHLAAMA